MNLPLHKRNSKYLLIIIKSATVNMSLSKQSSLFAFFQKSNKDIMSHSPEDSAKKRKADQIASTSTASSNENSGGHQQAPAEENPSKKVTPASIATTNNNQAKDLEEEDDFISQKPNLKRLRKSVRIDDDEDDIKENIVSTKPTSVDKSFAQGKQSSQSLVSRFESFRLDKNTSVTTTPHKEDIEIEKKSTTSKKKETKTPAKTPSKTTPATTKKNTPMSKASPEKTPSKEDEIIDVANAESGEVNINEFEDATPEWARPENARDAQGRRPEDPGYDPCTLYIPDYAWKDKRMTPTMKQFWKIKAQNYDKILLFKLGKFYELFYEDALICHKLLDLNWMGRKMHVGFPEKALDKYLMTITNAGHRVCVVEQTETPKEMEKRLKEQKGGDKTINREPVQMISKGTYTNNFDTVYDSKYLLVIRNGRIGESPKRIAVCFVDITTNAVTLGLIVDDSNFTNFKTMIAQLRPVEVVFEDLEIEKDIKTILSSSLLSPTFSRLNDPKYWNPINGRCEINTYCGQNQEKWPTAIKTLLEKLKTEDQELIFSVLAGFTGYLRTMLIAEQLMGTARFEIYDPESFEKRYMILDSQALQHLEVLEVSYQSKNPEDGSLFSYVNKTSTHFGRRMLRRWLCAPLLDAKAINERFDAVEDLQAVYSLRKRVMDRLKKLPDLERQVTKMYNYSIKQSRKVVMFEDISVAKLKEFQALMESFKEAREIVRNLGEVNSGFKSQMLRNLTELVDWRSMTKEQINDPSVTPDPLSLIDELQKVIKWEGDRNAPVPTPREGIDPDYDAKKAEIEAVHRKFNDHLLHWREKLNCKDICYANSKFRYELEIPAKYVEGKKKHPDLEFTSQKKDYQRFHTKEIKKMLEVLEEKEEELKGLLSKFIYFLFDLFHKENTLWDKFVRCIAQIDCLCSLSVVSLDTEKMCRPIVEPLRDANDTKRGVFMDIKDLRHPCVCMMMKEGQFIPNDIYLGDANDSANGKQVMVLTGPNMGGKSTLLRQACVAAILAQIGCYVPATSCKLSVVDRIFTRLGASDKLLEGKSTFYIEMEETVNAVKFSTKNSLVIMDELGRGTSTFDGVAIAYGVLKHLLDVVCCRTLFATHYHVLLEEFRDSYEHLAYYFMDCFFDAAKERIIFKYKLKQGECPRSFGIQVAKAAGIDQEIVKLASFKAQEFDSQLNLTQTVQVNKAFKGLISALSETTNNFDESVNKLQLLVSKLSINDQKK